MVVDWGLGLNMQQDLVSSAGPFIDFAKIAVGISRLYSNEVLTAKLRVYLKNDIQPFPGGQYLEFSEIEGKTDLYFQAAVEAGYTWVEVSDNIAPVSLEWKKRMISQAVGEFGLSVLGEVGRKEGLGREISLVDDAKVCLDSGSSIILLEAAELVSENEEIIREVEKVVEFIGLELVIFELPGPWISGINSQDVHQMRRKLIDLYGFEVNLGNVMPEDLMSLEAYRKGLGVNAGKGKMDKDRD